MKQIYILLIAILFGFGITTNAQFKDWGSKFGARYNLLLPQNEFPNTGFGENDKFSFDNYTMSYLLEGFVGWELTKVLELDINAGYGSYAGFQFDYTGYYKSEIIPVGVRLRIAPFDVSGWNPYLYIGAGIMHYSDKYFEENLYPSPVEVKADGWAGLFPVGIGAEFALSDMVLLDFSLGGAFTSSYDINNYDDGNNNVDAYYNVTLGLTITSESCTSDKDMDGLGKCEEEKLGTSPKNPDTDGDGLTDGEEVMVYKTNPLGADTDLDGLSDFDEIKQYKTDPLKADSDGDGLNDGEEVNKYKTDPLNTDSDNDGLTDGDEVVKYKTDPTVVDTDGDGLYDGEEVKTFTTNPLMKDTDGGTVSDSTEIHRGTNPLDPSDDVVKVEIGVPIILEGVTFATGSAEITPESENRLRKALKTLTTYPDISVEIDGYTDNVGSESSNQKLSEKRANALRDWLVREGIDPGRITAFGFGESNPIAPNDTPEGRQKNRRIEFKRTK